VLIPFLSLGVILPAAITLRCLILRSILLTVLIVPLLLLCVLRLLTLLGPLLLGMVVGPSLVLGFLLFRMAPAVVLLVMLRVQWCSDSDKQGQKPCTNHSICLHM
jgi:hypothetical protein